MKAYYNEIDPHAVAVLRDLIDAVVPLMGWGLIGMLMPRRS